MDGHSTTMIMLMTTLGLFKDGQPLLANNREDMLDRKFKTSHIAPYSANVGFILYVCDSEEGDGNTFTLQLLVNEEPMLIPGCDSMLCPYEQVREMYSHVFENCDLNEICTGAFTN